MDRFRTVIHRFEDLGVTHPTFKCVMLLSVSCWMMTLLSGNLEREQHRQQDQQDQQEDQQEKQEAKPIEDDFDLYDDLDYDYDCDEDLN